MRLIALVVLNLLVPTVAAAVTTAEILKKVDRVMAPEKLTMDAQMTTLRTNGITKTYRMMIYKRNDDLVRVEFTYPAVESGRKILRKGGNTWMMMKTIRRPMRISFKDSFMGGDFNNSDVLRMTLHKDYNGTIVSETPTQWKLKLTAKDPGVTYASAILWVNKADFILIKSQYFTSSGKMLRQMELSDTRTFHGHKRPAKMLMRNMMNKKTYSVMTLRDFKAGETLPPAMFRPDSLRR